MADDPMSAGGFYCSTSGTTFTSKEELNEHYKSDFHRYNLKRKVSGLPPVTREWFEARKAQLASTDAANAANSEKVLICSLTKKRFTNGKTYEAHTRSKKYKELLKKKGLSAAPAAIVMQKGEQVNPQPVEAVAKGSAGDGKSTFKVKSAVPSMRQVEGMAEDHMEADGEDDDSGWETASEEGDVVGDLPGEAASHEPWDPKRSLFDNHVSESMAANLEYMYKKFGFYLPDSEYLEDPEGLLAYLGLKMSVGLVPLYTRGDDESAKQFQSVHAVQRHMVDTNQCRIVYDDNEEEYEEFYDFSAMDGQEDAAMPLAVTGDEASGGAAGSYELVLAGDSNGKGGKVLGSREFARYYKQKPKPIDGRRSVEVGTMVAQYRQLGIATAPKGPDEVQKKAQKWIEHRTRKLGQITFMQGNINRNLPKNVPY